MPAPSNGELSLSWQRAALIGGVWGSLEIILGSFLHNLQIPFTGTLLASVGISLSVASQILWRQPDIIWRAGVICAMMKSVSPSSMILGPMIGIAGESFLLYGCVFLFQPHRLSFWLGGMLAAMMPLIQKTVSYLFTYGWDFARLYLQVYRFAAGSLHVTDLGPLDLIYALLLGNALLGAAAAEAGIRLGRNVTASPPSSSALPDAAGAVEAPFSSPPTRKYSLRWLAFHLAAVAGTLLSLPRLPWWAGAAAVSLYLLACLYRYPQALRRFRQPRLWIELTVISLLAGWLLSGWSSTEGSGLRPWEGLRIGFFMVLRAVLVVFGFASVSVELRNPQIVNWLLNRGMGQFSAALQIAFRTLPAMTALMGKEKAFLRNPFQAMARMLAAARTLPAVNPGSEPPFAPTILLTGPRASGKTQFLLSLAEELRSRGIPAGGILAPGIWQEGRRSGYDLLEPLPNRQMPLCRLDPLAGGICIGPFHFDPAAIAAGRQALTSAASGRLPVIFVDEIGPLEMQGQGWAPALEVALGKPASLLVLVVRPELVDAVTRRWGFRPRHIWHAGHIDLPQAIAHLQGLIPGDSAFAEIPCLTQE